MGEHWQAEAVVDESLARTLIRAQCAGVPADTVELVAAGWDYTIHRVDGEWAFRFPRRAVVLEPMRTELRVLPALAPHLPVAVPDPVHLGAPSAAFPWPFYGSRWIPGAEATGAGSRPALAPQLGRALRALHDAPLGGLEVDVQRRADIALPPSAPSAGCHGDLHFRQVLVDGERVTGIVDWVDVCRSDPGIDLAFVFMYFDPPERDSFFEAYGVADDASTLRARVLALFLGAVLARYGRAQANAPVEREAIAALDRAVSGL